MQVADVLARLARGPGLPLVLVAGGMPYAPQTLAFSRGVDIVVATPGRLIDLIERGSPTWPRRDRGARRGGPHGRPGLPAGGHPAVDHRSRPRQRLLFSATLDHAVDRFVRNYLREPVTHQVDNGQASVATMSHHLVASRRSTRLRYRRDRQPRGPNGDLRPDPARGGPRRRQLRGSRVLAGALHGGLAQGARNRMLTAFKMVRSRVLVATDVAARGIHVDEVGLVLQLTRRTDQGVPAPRRPYRPGGRTGPSSPSRCRTSVATWPSDHAGRRTPEVLTVLPGIARSPQPRAPGGRREAVSDPDYQRVIAPPPARRSRSAGSAAATAVWLVGGEAQTVVPDEPRPRQVVLIPSDH